VPRRRTGSPIRGRRSPVGVARSPVTAGGRGAASSGVLARRITGCFPESLTQITTEAACAVLANVAVIPCRPAVLRLRGHLAAPFVAGRFVAGRTFRSAVVPRCPVTVAGPVASAGPIAVAGATAVARALAVPTRPVAGWPVRSILPGRGPLGPLSNGARLGAVGLIPIPQRAVIGPVTVAAVPIGVRRPVTIAAGPIGVRRPVTLAPRSFAVGLPVVDRTRPVLDGPVAVAAWPVATGRSVTVCTRAVAGRSIRITASTGRPVGITPGPLRVARTVTAGAGLLGISLRGPTGRGSAVGLIPVTAGTPAVRAVPVGPGPGAVRRRQVVRRTPFVPAVRTGALAAARGPITGGTIRIPTRSSTGGPIGTRPAPAGATSA